MARPRRPSNTEPLLQPEDVTLEDIEAIRLLLRGGSIIDWHRLDFRDYSDVDRFLRVNEFNPTDAEDSFRLEALRVQAVDYLMHNFEFDLPREIAEDLPARDLFLVASRKGPGQVWACVILKVMHIVHHLAGRELSTRLPISFDRMYHAIELKVMQVVEELRGAGYPIMEFEWSRKTPDSLITKLLSKRSTLAANIYDKLRFRMILRQQRDLLPMMAALHRRLIPFNYVVPGESVNHLIPFDGLQSRVERLRQARPDEETSLEREQVRHAGMPLNEFSAPNYKIINFVADLPVRVDSFGAEPLPDYGHVVFVLTEFQLGDKQTATANELGDNNHGAYKQRQHGRVRERLLRGQHGDALKVRESIDYD